MKQEIKEMLKNISKGLEVFIPKTLEEKFEKCYRDALLYKEVYFYYTKEVIHPLISFCDFKNIKWGSGDIVNCFTINEVVKNIPTTSLDNLLVHFSKHGDRECIRLWWCYDYQLEEGEIPKETEKYLYQFKEKV